MTNQPEPKGKRTIRHTVRGSYCGYIGGRFWINFGDDRFAAQDAEQWAEAE